MKLRQEEIRHVLDILIELGIISILFLAIISLESITFEQTLLLFIFLCFFIFEYLALSSKQIAKILLSLLFLGISFIAIRIYGKILVAERLATIQSKIIRHLTQPLFQIWLIFATMLIFYYLYRKWEVGYLEKISEIENLFLILTAIIIYSLNHSLSITVNVYNYVCSLPYTSLLLLLTGFLWIINLLMRKNTQVFYNQFVYSLSCASLLLITSIIILLPVSLLYSFDFTLLQEILQPILAIFLFGILININICTEKRKSRFKLFLSLILGVIVLVYWIKKIIIPEFYIF